jgi:hypothetical protein
MCQFYLDALIFRFDCKHRARTAECGQKGSERIARKSRSQVEGVKLSAAAPALLLGHA